MKYHLNKIITTQSGFTLIEVLIATVILSIGLLGVAALQLAGLKDSNRSNERSIATFLAYDIVDRIRANIPGAINGNYLLDPDNPPAAPSVSGSSAPQDFCRTDFTATARAGFCSDQELASADIYDWFSSIQNALPGGMGEITCTDANTTDAATCSAGSRYVITIMWDDSRSNVNGKNCDPNDEDDLLCFSITTEI